MTVTADAMQRETAGATTPMRYGLVLPPGWARVSLTDGDADVRRLLDRMFARVGRDETAALRRDVTTMLEGAARQAREQYGIDMYLPVDGRNGVPVAASVVVSHLPLGATPTSPGAGAVAVVTSLAESGSAATPSVVAGQPAARAEWTTRASGVAFAELPGQRCRHVTYVTPTPASTGWLVVAFTTTEHEGVPELAAGYVALFDAIVTTLRWVV